MILEFDRNGQPEYMVSTLMDSVQRAIKPVEQIASAAYESGSDSEDIVGMIKDIMLETIYPVGSYYETSNTEFNPNGVFLGVWVLETEGQVHVSSGENYVVSGALTNVTDGGEATVELQVENLPAHTHNPNVDGELFVTSADAEANNTRVAYSSDGNRWVDGQTSTSHFRHRSTSGSAGSGTAHENMQPYIVVNRWHRTE